MGERAKVTWPKRVPRPRYSAREGEMVYCQNGHEVGRLAHDLVYGDVMCGDEIVGLHVPLYQSYPCCKRCGAFFTLQGGGFIFHEGPRR
jgi:hypothetical protein